jgi:hypothetical protein
VSKIGSRKLPSQLISLIHHVTLNEAGWWDKTLQRFIASSVWLTPDDSTVDNIVFDLKESYGIAVEKDIVEKELEKLRINDIIIKIDRDRYRLTENSQRKYESELIKYEKLEESAKDIFAKILEKLCVGLNVDDCWKHFNDGLLIPLVHELGARTYELISGSKASIDQTTKFQKFIKEYEECHYSGMRQTILAFFSPDIRISRDFILGKINAYFCMEAGNLSKTALDKLSNLTRKNFRLDLFLDTNFLFSILELHENPSNEAAKSLKELIDNIKNKLNIKLYVIPETVKEAIKVLSYNLESLKGIRFVKNILSVSRNHEFGGFAKKYFDEIQKSRKSISPEEYFEPYLKNLVAALRSHGVELYNKDLDYLKSNQNLIDDLNDITKYEERVFKSKAKNYDQILHDLILWYFVKNGRPTYVETPIDVNSWIVTVDFRFLGFDSLKRRHLHGGVSQICIHPATLIQILQFWTPRTEQFETAIINNIRTPFVINEFDNDSEKITLKILSALSRYEDMEDLSEDTIESILVNDALRSRVAASKEINEQVELVKDALVLEHTKIIAELEYAKSKYDELTSKIRSQEEVTAKLSDHIDLIAEDKERLLKDRIKLEDEIEKTIIDKDKHKQDFIEERKARLKAENKYREKYRKEFVRQKISNWRMKSVYLFTIGLALPAMCCIYIFFQANWSSENASIVFDQLRKNLIIRLVMYVYGTFNVLVIASLGYKYFNHSSIEAFKKNIEIPKDFIDIPE